jgi:hypothetical protein
VGLLLVGKDHPAAAVGRQARGSRWPHRLRPAPARPRRGIGDRGPGVGGIVELDLVSARASGRAVDPPPGQALRCWSWPGLCLAAKSILGAAGVVLWQRTGAARCRRFHRRFVC